MCVLYTTVDTYLQLPESRLILLNMRTTIVINILIACLLLTLSQWTPHNGTGADMPLGEPTTTATDVAMDAAHGDDAVAAASQPLLPSPAVPILFASTSVHTRLTSPAIFRPPIA